jgi:hypothetical protein
MQSKHRLSSRGARGRDAIDHRRRLGRRRFEMNFHLPPMRNGTMAPIMDARTHVAALVASLLAASLLACGSAKAATCMHSARGS